MTRINRCRLCGQNKPLIKSHILPEFFYKRLYDEKHCFHRLKTPAPPKKAKEQKGIREELLCRECENQFSKYEDHACRVLDCNGFKWNPTPDSQRYEIQVNYQLFKLFELSLIWRAGIASIDDFNEITLGSHERKIRKMLVREEPGESDRYGCLIALPVSNRLIIREMVHCIGRMRIQGTTFYGFVLGGLCWLFFLSKDAIHTDQKGAFLQEDGQLHIIISDAGLDTYIPEIAAKLHACNPRVFSKFG